MKYVKKRLQGLWILIFLFVVGMTWALIFLLNENTKRVINAKAYADTNVEEKYYCHATLDDSFSENRIIVVLSEKETMRFIEYSPCDFSDVGVSKVEELTCFYKNVIRESALLSLEKSNFRTILSLTLEESGKENVLSAIKTLETRVEIISAEPDYTIDYEQMPNDNYYASNKQWGLSGTSGIQAPYAWNIATGSSSVNVGIIDTGIDASHEDLKNRVNKSLSIDLSNNSNSSGALNDTYGHGTHVAGIIGAQGDNSVGVSGVNWNVGLVSLKIFEDGQGNSNTFETALIRAVNYAAANDIPVLSNSNGLDEFNGSSVAFETVLKAYPGLFVTSAGNAGRNNDANSQRFPSNIDLPNVISVGSIDENGGRSSFSNYGINTVDIYAPGGNIYSTLPNNKYGNNSGTSMATPFVSGVAALLLSLNSSLTGAELKTALLSGADTITISTPDGSQSVRKLNAYEAMYAIKIQPDDFFAGGTGAAYDPFLISNENQFRKIGLVYRQVYITYQGYEKRNNYAYKLTNNIILHGDWSPFKYKFAGDFNGNNYSITYDMTISQSDLSNRYLGLFGFVVSGGKIYDLELKNCTIKSNGNSKLTTTDGGVNVGVLAGSFFEAWGVNNVKIINPIVECNIQNASVGGIAGTAFTTSVTDCMVSGGSITNYDGMTGGMAGNGDLDYFTGGSCTTTLTKNSYSDGDLVGPVVGNSQNSSTVDTSKMTINKKEDPKCIAAGTLITLADGSQVPVEILSGNELLLVWNLYTGQFDTASILFVDSDPMQLYKVINLSFSDGTSVKVIYEHGFWDYDLNKYVYLDENAAQYIGHWFSKQITEGNGTLLSERTQLLSVEIQYEYITVYSPVTAGHLCYFVNGMLSMPGGIGGLFNIFEVDAETMRYNEEAFNRDIAQYGLFTFEEFAEFVPVSEEMFEVFGGQYLKVAIGKGLITVERLEQLALRYSVFFE